GHLRDRLHPFPTDGHVDQVRRAGQVVVPEAVMHHLEVPDAFPGLRVQADQALAEETRTRAVAAVPVVVRRPDRKVDVAEVRVVAHRRPDISGPGVLPGTLLPGVVAELT